MLNISCLEQHIRSLNPVTAGIKYFSSAPPLVIFMLGLLEASGSETISLCRMCKGCCMSMVADGVCFRQFGNIPL